MYKSSLKKKKSPHISFPPLFYSAVTFSRRNSRLPRAPKGGAGDQVRQEKLEVRKDKSGLCVRSFQDAHSLPRASSWSPYLSCKINIRNYKEPFPKLKEAICLRWWQSFRCPFLRTWEGTVFLLPMLRGSDLYWRFMCPLVRDARLI